ncbi:hypothetical protein MMC08_004991, partial [Hypocenomyce scalaris]|nr:hypothetical protein [Hypocenomyce scalaris]
MNSAPPSSNARGAPPLTGDFDTSHSTAVRRYLRTYGLTPPNVESYETQASRCLKQLALKTIPIDKYLYLSNLRNTNVHLFYRLVVDHVKDLTPLIYTPVVGEACLKWSEIYQQREGLYISYSDRGNIASVLQNWPQPNVEITVITDGSRILGLGDLGVNGMGIPVGKLALYVGCAGIRPEATLPMTLDLGTGNKALRDNPLYMGSRREKVNAQEEREFLDELMVALVEKWPGIVIQFEDFKNPFPALERYGGKYTCFNDDIQGTGAVVLAGIINAVRRSGVPIKDQRAVFMGAGSAGVGVAKQIVQYFMEGGLTEDEARQCFWLVDTKGLVTDDRGDKLADHKVYFSRHDNAGKQYKNLSEVVEFVKPTILMGLSTMWGIFDKSILTKMGQWHKHPIIFPLSNPSANSECTFEEAMEYTGGRALFASGSPFPPIQRNGVVHTPGQGNNVFIFPGVGFGSILSKATTITQSMIYASATALSTSLSPSEVDQGWLYPDIGRIREVSVIVAMGVIRAAQESGVDREIHIRGMGDKDLEQWVRAKMYNPHAETRRVQDEVDQLLGHGGEKGGVAESRFEKSEAPSPEGRRRKDYDQRSTQRPSVSIISSKSARNPSRGDDRDRGFNPTSTSYSSSSRSPYPGTASASIASSYATANSGQPDEPVLPPGLVRNASLANQIPKSRSSRDERDQDRDRERQSERRRDRSSSRDRKRDRDGKKRERRDKREKGDRGDGKDRGLARPGSGYAEELDTSRTGEVPGQTSGSFSAQVQNSGFTQFPGQYDGEMPGFTSGPPPLPESMSAHVQDQFPGQFPMESAAPYRPPLAASEGGPGLAAEYYGDAGESVAEQPGVRPHPPALIVGAEPHLLAASPTTAPPPEPSSAGGVGAAASFYNGENFQPTQPSQPFIPVKPSRPGKTSRPSMSGSFSGSAALAGSAVLGYTAGITGETIFTQENGSNSTAYYQHEPGRPPLSTTGYSPTSAPMYNGYHASSAPILPTLGAAAAGAAAGYMMGGHSSGQQQPSAVSDHSEYSSPATQRPPSQPGGPAIGISNSSRPPRPAKHSSQFSNIPVYAAGQFTPMAQRHRHSNGPLGTFVEFWTDPDGVAQYEEYTEYIGVCRNCFAPGSSPRDAPREHHYRRRGSNERYGSSTRVDKESRWGSSDGENRRRSRKSWLATGIAGYGLAEVGKTLFNQKRDFDDTYSVRSGRVNASNSSLLRRKGSYSPRRGSRTSYGVTGGSSSSKTRRRSRSQERVETGVTSDGKIYKKATHGSLVGGPNMITYSPRRRSRSRSGSRSRDRHNGLAGAALGSSVMASISRRRSPSPKKSFVRSEYRSREHSPGRGESSVLGGLFGSPSEMGQRSHTKKEEKKKKKKKKKGFFSFGNSSSSSADADLAFGAGLEGSRDRKKRSTRSRNDRNADAALLGLSAAAAAIAVGESQKGSKASRRANLVAVKESKSRNSPSSERHHRERRTSASPTMEEDLWESASEEDDSSSANSALAYGGPARKNQESLPSDSSGTGKWGWRWGSKKKLKRTAQANSSSNIFHIPAGTAAATLAGATAGAAVASDVWPNDSRMSSSSNLPPLQQVYPVPTSDPSRFDVTRHDSIASSNRPIVTSRPAPVPLQQPQPRAPVSNTVYTTQAPYGHSYSAPGGPPSGPPMFTQISYQTQPSMVGPPRDTFNGSTQTNLPGSFPGGDIVSENALRNGRKEFTRSQRDTSPILRTAESEMNSIPRRRRASTRDETSAVRFDLSEEPTGEDLRDRLPHKRGVDQKREEVKFQDADDQRQFDNERRTSHEIPSRSTESTSGPEEKLDRKRETRRQRRDDESKDKKKGQWVVPVAAGAMGAAIGASALEAADFAAETRQDKRREESPRDRVEDGEGRASDEPKYPSQRRTGRQDSGEQQVQIAQQVSSKIVKSPSHENYAAYFTPPELLSKSNYDSPGIDVNGDNNVTSYQIPQIITVEPKGPRPSFPPAYAFPDEVDLDHMTLPWQVPRLNLIQPTPPHSIAGSTKGDASPIITPEDSRVEETEETPKSATTPRVTWGEDETHTYQVITPLDNPEEFIGPSTKLRNGEEDVHLPSEASPLDTTPIIVERAPRHVPGDFGDDLEFAATVAAGLEDTGFNPAIVIDDPNFRRRDSPPWSEQTGFYRRPFAETVTDLGLESPGTEGAPPQQGFVEGELPPTPKYQQGPSANGNPVDDSASKLSKKGKERREKIQQRQSEDDVPTSVSSVSVLDYEGGMFHEPGKYSTEPEPMVSIPVNVNDYLDEGPSVEETKGENPKKDVGEPESASSGSPVQTDPARSEYFDAPEAAAQASKPSNTSREVDQVMVDVPSSEQAVDDFQDSNRAYKEEKKSKKSQRDGLIYEFPAKTPGSLALERTSEVSSKRKADRKSSRRDSERYELPSGGSSSVVSEPVSEEYGERKQSRSRGSTGDRDLYGATPENPRSISVPIEDRFEEPRKSKKKSKRGSSGYDDVPTSMSLPATLEDKRDSKSKFRKDKKAGPLGLFGASKSSDKLSESGQAKDTVAEATSDVFEEPKRKSRKSNERRSTRDGDDVSSQVSDNTTERLPETALAGDLDADVTSDDFDDPKEKRKKSKGRKSTSTRDGDDVYSQVSQGTSDLSRLESDNDDGKSRRKERRRRSQESDIVEASGRITQDLQAKVYKAASPGRYTAFMMSQALIIPEARDSTSTREGPIIDRSDVVNATGVSGKDEPMSFLGERQEIPPPPDINIPTDPQILHAETTVENPRSSTVQPESEVGRISGNHEARITSPLAVFPLEDLPPLPGSRPTSPVPEVEGRRRRLSVVQTSESSQSPAATPSSTAIPLYFRRPPQSPGFARSSPLASPATPAQKAAIFVSPQRRSRPNSTEFKSSTEFRPLWLVERHRSRQEPAPEESYPSLPSSHSTSRSSSVHDPEEIDMYRNGDYGLIGSQEGSDGEALGVTIDTILEFEQSELLGSRQATPTATSFHADVHENALAEAAQRSGPAERSQSHQDNARDAVHGVSPSSPQRLPHSGGDLFPGRRAVSPSRYSPEDVEDLPPLPASRSSSPLQKASRLGSSAVLEVAEPMEDLPPLPASRSSSPLQKASRLGSSAVLEVAEPLEDLPPLPASRSSSPLREDQRRGTSPLLKGAVMGAFVGVAAAAAALGTAHHDKVSARDDLREAKADSLDVLEVPTEIVRDEASTTSTAENIDEPEMLLTEASKKKVKHNQKGSRSMREHDPPVQVESGPPSAINQDIGASTTDDERDLQEQDIREPVDTLFIPSMLKKTKKGKKGKKKGRGNESSNAEADSLGSSSIEASSLRKSRAVSPSGVVAVSGGPTISEPGLMAALQSTEAGEDDWPGFLAGSKKLKGKKSKKKFARSWQEEPIEPGVTGGDVGLEHHPESLGSQASTTDYEEKNTCHPPLSDVDVGPTDVVRHLTRKVTLELVPNAEESERLGGTNQEGRETEEHLVVKEELVSERSPILQQPLDTAGQAPQFPSNKSFWARDLPEIRDEDTATSTPQKDADEHFIVPIKAAKKGKKKGKTLQLDHYVEPSAPPTKYVDTSVEQIEAFAPNDAEQPRNILGSNGEGITQSTQEQEPQLETEFTVPFKASNKGKKKRKTLPVDDYLESSTPLAEAEEILTKRDIHEDGQAGETDGLVGGTTTTSHNTFERVLEPSAGIEKSFAGGYQVRAPPPTFQGPDALDLTSEAVPLPMTKDLDLLEALPASPAAQHLSAEAIPLPTDEDLDLLEALPASPILEPSDITSRESEHAHEYVSRLETDKDPALTLLPSAPADGSDHMMLDQAPETLTPEKDDIQDQIAVPKLLPELGDVQRDAPSVLARVAGDTHDDAPPSVKRASDPDRSLTQETADDFFASVSKGKGKNGKKDYQSLSISPDLGPASTESDFPAGPVTTEKDSTLPSRTIGTEITQEQSNEGDWDIPSKKKKKKKKSKKGDKEKSASIAAGYASQEADSPPDLPNPGSDPVYDAQEADIIKDLTDSPELRKDLSLPEPEEEAAFAWEPTQKKSKKGKTSKTQIQQSLTENRSSAGGERPDIPAAAEKPFATTDTAHAVREMLIDRGSTPGLEPASHEVNVVGPVSNDYVPKHEAIYLEISSQVEEDPSREVTNEEGSTERQEAGVPSTRTPTLDNLLAPEGKLASTNTAREVQSMLANQDSPQLSDEFSREDSGVPTLVTQALTEQSLEDDEPWNNPVKKIGKKAKKGRTVQGPVLITDESSKIPTPPVEPETTPLNDEGVTEAPENFTSKKSKKFKKEKRGKKKASWQSVSDFAGEVARELVPLAETVGLPVQESAIPPTKNNIIEPVEQDAESSRNILERAATTELPTLSTSQGSQLRPFHRVEEPKLNKDPDTKTAKQQSYFDQAIRPTEIQELPLSPQPHSDELLDYAASLPLPLDKVEDSPVDVPVQDGEESEAAWSRAVDSAGAENIQIESPRSQQFPQSSLDEHLTADQSGESSVLKVSSPMAIETTLVVENTREPVVGGEDDVEGFTTKKTGKKDKRQQRKLLERQETDNAEVPISHQSEVPGTEDRLGSSVPVDEPAFDIPFSPEMGDASRDALRELELEDGVSYFGLTAADSGTEIRRRGDDHQTTLANEEDWRPVHKDHPMTGR